MFGVDESAALKGQKSLWSRRRAKTVRGLQNQRVTRMQMPHPVDVFFKALPTDIFIAIYSSKGQKHNLFPLAWYCVRLL